MPTRFHLHASGSIAPANNPAFDAGWEQTGEAVRLPMDVKSRVVATTTLANTANITVPVTTTQQILCAQFTSNQVFPPVRLDASVRLSIVIRCAESATQANVFLAYVLSAFKADGSASLGTLSSSMTNAGTEFPTTAATRIFGDGATTVALTNTLITEPWRLVLDVGGHAQGPTQAQTYLLRFGNSAASDFALTSALTTDLNPWIELSTELRASRFNNYQGVNVGSGMNVAVGVR